MTSCAACRIDPEAAARAYYERVVPPPPSGPTPFARRIATTVEALVPPPAHVLDLAAGCGEATLELSGVGYRVVAVERSRTRAVAARITALSAPLRAQRVLETSIERARPGRRFDVVLLLNAFGIGDDAGHAVVLSRIAELMRPGGHALVDVFDPDWWQAQARSDRPFIGGHRQVAYCHACSRVVTTVRRGGAELHEAIRCYSPAAFAQLAGAQGLRVIGQADRLPAERGAGRRTSVLRHVA